MINKEDALKILTQRNQTFTNQNTNGLYSEFKLILMNTQLARDMAQHDPYDEDKWSTFVKHYSDKIINEI